MLKHNIFVCGHRKSGTSLLVKLLDNHSNLSVCPFDLTIFYAYFPNEQRFEREKARERLKSVIFANWVNEMSAEKYVDIQKMENMFFKFCNENYDIQTVYHALVQSFEKVSFQENREYRVTKETSLELHATEIDQMFPESKFIHVVRNPLDNFASILSGLGGYYGKYNDNYFSLLHSLIDRVNLGLRIGLENYHHFGSRRYMFIRYEDLVQKPRSTISEITKFIGVPVENSCFKPSVLGHDTPGNSFVETQQYEISTGRIGTHKKNLSNGVLGFLSIVLSDLMEPFSYDPVIDNRKTALDFASKYYDYVNKKDHFFDRF